MISLPTLLQAVINGLLLGGIYALLALGLNVIFGVLKIINFAHGEFLMIGMYITYWLNALYGIHPYVSLLIVVPILFLFGAGIERIAIRPVLKASPLNQMLVTVALMLILENAALTIWSANYRVITVPSTVFIVGGMRIPDIKLVALLISLFTSAILYFVLKRTSIGRSIRAVALNSSRASLLGINVSRILNISFGIGSALAGAAACLLTTIYFVSPSVGGYFVLIAFVVVIFGGLGSFPGALIGGFLIGVVESLAGVLLNVEMARAVALFILLIVLFFKPEGIFGEKTR